MQYLQGGGDVASGSNRSFPPAGGGDSAWRGYFFPFLASPWISPCETTSPKSGKIQWEGTVRGGQIDVRYVWTDAAHWYKPNLKPLEMWGKGEWKKPE